LFIIMWLFLGNKSSSNRFSEDKGTEPEG